MTVLKSFDLKGNKQSFAGWISNLSPCDTPFVSMIGKEGIDEAQYSWQMDALDKPKNDGFEEGSDAEADKREPTHILHNFTSILRKVANVSDTVAAIGTYGRNKEVEYQMGKAGKELKRDMEFMCLNNEEGNIGTGSLASNFSGFTALCAPEGYIDHSTGARTHKSVGVADMTGPWFKTSDLFDLTYNLYLAGSKANKIMFHPYHATTFTDFMSNNIETGLVYRMFDGVDAKYNAQVTKIRDPLGQVYDLIPNRFMPMNKVYVFTESDWTQMILRAPSATKLAKTGASERFLLETEIGLRHRHINASGVMDLVPSTLIMEWTEKPSPMTWGVNHNEEAEITITNRVSGAPIVDGTVVDWTSSNPVVLELTDTTGQTANGKATNVLKPLKAGTSIITATIGDSRASYLVTVKDPSIRLTLSNSLVEKDQKFLAVVQVLKADGTAVDDNITVNFKADPSALVTLASIQAPTTGGSGTAQVEVTAGKTTGLVQFQATVGLATSNYAKLEIVEKVQELVLRIDRRVISNGINDSTLMEVSVVNATGAAIPSQSVSLLSTDSTVVQIAHTPVDTGTSGTFTSRLTALSFGETEILAQYQGQEVALKIAVTPPNIVLTCPPTAKVNEPFSLAATVTRSDGSFIESADVEFKADPPFSPVIPSTSTGSDGIARASHTESNNSDFEVSAEVGNYKSNVCNLSVSV